MPSNSQTQIDAARAAIEDVCWTSIKLEADLNAGVFLATAMSLDARRWQDIASAPRDISPPKLGLLVAKIHERTNLELRVLFENWIPALSPVHIQNAVYKITESASSSQKEALVQRLRLLLNGLI